MLLFAPVGRLKGVVFNKLSSFPGWRRSSHLSDFFNLFLREKKQNWKLGMREKSCHKEAYWLCNDNKGIPARARTQYLSMWLVIPTVWGTKGLFDLILLWTSALFMIISISKNSPHKEHQLLTALISVSQLGCFMCIKWLTQLNPWMPNRDKHTHLCQRELVSKAFWCHRFRAARKHIFLVVIHVHVFFQWINWFH